MRACHYCELREGASLGFKERTWERALEEPWQGTTGHFNRGLSITLALDPAYKRETDQQALPSGWFISEQRCP